MSVLSKNRQRRFFLERNDLVGFHRKTELSISRIKEPYILVGSFARTELVGSRIKLKNENIHENEINSKTCCFSSGEKTQLMGIQLSSRLRFRHWRQVPIREGEGVASVTT